MRAPRVRRPEKERRETRCLRHHDCRQFHELGAACYAQRLGWRFGGHCQCRKCFVGPHVQAHKPLSESDFIFRAVYSRDAVAAATTGVHPMYSLVRRYAGRP